MAGTSYRIAYAASNSRSSYSSTQPVPQPQQVPHIVSQPAQSVQQTQSIPMAAQQYNFPPPPPPPGPPPSNHPQYAYQPQQPQYQQPQRAGGGLRGRGNHQSGPYNPNQPGLYNGPPQGLPQGPPQHQPGPPNGYQGPNGQQSQPTYIGPQAPQGPPNHQGPPNGYPGPQPQWQNNQQNQQQGPQHRGPPQPQRPPQPPMQQLPMQQQQQPPLQVAPLSTNNYHPNYAPQLYQPQYGSQQPPQQYQSPQPPYGHSVPNQQPHGGPPPQWNGPPQPARPPFNNNRGRGGFQNVRGGHEAPLMGPPIRMGFDNDRGGHMAQAGNGYPPQYQTQTPVQFPQAPPYQTYPPANYSGQRSSLDPNPYNSGPNRGRGGNVNNFRGKGRGDFQQSRGRDNRHHSNGHRAPSENFHKQQPAGADANGGKKKKKRRTNTLGLTPNGADREESDEEIDDVDEEARLVTLLGPDTPQLPTDLDAWLAERRSRFPTKARREAALAELRQRREQNRNSRNNKEPSIKKEEGETKLEKQQRKADKLRRELEKTERKIQAEASGTSKRKRENGDEGDEERGQASEDDSNSSSSSESEDSPEVASSRHHVPMRVHQPPKAQLQRHCKYFSTGGTCGKKGKCRFVHDQEVRNQALREKEANGGKMTLAQRLILNDTAKDDLTILKSIKYLKEKGLMPDQLTSSVGSERFKSEEDGYAENLNYGDN